MTSVKFFHNAMAGAPNPLSNNGVKKFGAILDACLVTGFGQQTATSLVVSGGVATLTLPGTPFEIDAVILVEGSSIAALNGEKRVTGFGGATNTFDAAGVPNGTASGTVTVKYAPVGWSKPFSDSTNDVFRSNDETGTRFFYRLNAYGNTHDVIGGYENMTAATVGTGQFGSGGSVPGTSVIPYYNGTGSVAYWTVIADSKTVYIHVSQTTTSGYLCGFGDFASFAAVDQFRAFTCGEPSTNIAMTTPGMNSMYDLGWVGQSSGANLRAARSHNGVMGQVLMNTGIESFYSGTAGESGALGGNMAPAYPNASNQGLILSRCVLTEPSALRGYLRGFYLTPQNCHAQFAHGARVVGQGAFAGRKLMAVKCGSHAGASSQGVVFIDITGPWA